MTINQSHFFEAMGVNDQIVYLMESGKYGLGHLMIPLYQNQNVLGFHYLKAYFL